MLLLTLLACKDVEATPPDLDALLHAMWTGWDPADDAALGQVAVDLAEVIDEEELLDAEQRGDPTRLTRDDLAGLDLEGDPDPAVARGIHVLNRFPCGDVALLDAILSYPDQDALYGDYDSYARTFHADRDDYLDAVLPRLTWTAEASASNLATGGYSQVLEGGLRRVPLPEGHPFAGDVALFGRTYLPRPAETERESTSFDQDYQIEAYLPGAGGDIVHVYAIWRQITMGSLGDMESDVVANVTMQNMVAWDRKTAGWCEDGLP